MTIASLKWIPVAASLALFSLSPPAATLNAHEGAEITLSTVVSREVKNDECVVELTVTREAKTAAAAQKALLEVTARGMNALKKVLAGTDSEMQSGRLYTNANYVQRKPGSKSEIVSWTSRGSLSVTLRDPSLAGQVIEASTPYFEFSGMQFQVSKKAARAQRSEMIGEAVSDLGDKAAVIAKNLGRPVSDVKLIRLNFSGETGYHPYRGDRMMVMAAAPMAAKAAAPNFESGKSDVQLSASAVFQVGEKPAKEGK